MIDTKTCRACKEALDLSSFWKNWPLCKPCDRKRQLSKIEQIRERDRVRALRPDRQESRRSSRIRSEERHAEKRRARQAVHIEVLRGRIARGRCEICGEPNAHAHHDDYSKPLQIRWLCPLHHAQHHAEEAAAAKNASAR